MEKQNYVLYNSSEYNSKCLLKSELFLCPNTYGAQEKLLSSKEITPDSITLYNNDEYCELEIGTYSDEVFELLKEAIINNDLRQKFDLIRTQLTIYPNDKDKTFSLIIADISFFTQININELKLTHIYFNQKNSYMHSDSDQEIDTNKIFKYLERNVLSFDEKQFIKNIQETQYKTISAKKDSSKGFFTSLFKNKSEKNKEDNKYTVSSTEQKIFNMDALKIVKGSDHPEDDLNNLIGLENVKKEIIKLKAKLEYKKKREQRGIYDDSTTNLHMCFLGSPGTGKTTVARIMTGLLYDLGYLKENKCIEIGANELKGGYTGQTAIKTKAILRNAKNKILFIDEAYSLFDKNGGYGQEALDVIIKEMEDNKDNLIIIFAGYQKEMEKFLNMNDGLKSRINRYIYFENYNTLEMGKIFTSFLANKKLYIDEDALEKSLILFKNAGLKDRFSNGRFARNLLEKVEEEHAFNVRNVKDNTRRDTITSEDISTDIVRELLTQSM